MDCDKPTMRIVTLGKTGSGKSSLLNSFMENESFTVNHFPNSETSFCRSKNKTNGMTIQLVDTPGFFDTDKGKPDLKDALLECITVCAPGPHAFLLVFKVDKFTEQEQAVVDEMLEYFSEEALKFTTVVFTHGNQLPGRMEITDWVKKNKRLNDLVEKCGGRCCVVDNKYWNNSQDPYRNNQYQIKQLLQNICTAVIESDGNCYTNEMLLQVQRMKEEEKRRLKESSPNLSEEQREEKANNSVTSKLKENWIGVTVGAILGALLGAGVGAFVGGSLGGIKGGAIGAVVGGAIGAGLGGAVGGLLSEAAKKLKVYLKSPHGSGPEYMKLLKSD